MVEAGAAAQDFLDRTARAILGGDWPTYRDMIALPFTLDLADSRIIMTDEPALRQGFDSFRGLLHGQGITEMVRIVDRTMQDAVGQVAATYHAHYLRRNVRIGPPLPGSLLMAPTDGHWRVLSVRASLSGARWPMVDLAIAGGAPADPASRRVITGLAPDPVGMTAPQVSQFLLDLTGRALQANDFDGFASRFLLPQTITTYQTVSRLKDRDDLRSVYDNIRAHFGALKVDQVIRTCNAATFHGPDHVSAMHTSRAFSGGHEVQDAWPCLSQLHRINGQWLVGDTQYALTDSCHVAALQPLHLHIRGKT